MWRKLWRLTVRTTNWKRPNIQPPAPTNESRPGTKILLYCVFAISLRIATSSKQRFWKLTLKIILALLRMARHLTCFECFDSTCWFQPVRRGLKSGQDCDFQKANRMNSKFISDYGRRDASYISHFASKVQCNGQQFAGSEGNWHLNISQHAQVWKNGTFLVVADTEVRHRPQLGNNPILLAGSSGCWCTILVCIYVLKPLRVWYYPSIWYVSWNHQ